MAHTIENKVRTQNPEVITGVNIKKVNDAVGTITHRVGQRGHTVMMIDVKLQDLFSVKEIQTLAYKLVTNHRLRIKDICVEPGWRDHTHTRTSANQTV